MILEAAKFGLFLVPVGELEGRLAGRGLTTSKDRKAERATEAAALIGRLGYQPDDVWEFISNVERFLFPTNPEEELNAVPRTEA